MQFKISTKVDSTVFASGEPRRRIRTTDSSGCFSISDQKAAVNAEFCVIMFDNAWMSAWVRMKVLSSCMATQDVYR
jgi:hypothetical protein